MLLLHLKFLFEENGKVNLTRICTYEKAIPLHIEDSLSVLSEIGDVRGRLLDIGTGGGFPGLPLAVASGKEFTLLDSVRKKAAATKRIVGKLGLLENVHICDVRSEELALEAGGAFDAVVMRAVSGLAVCEELAAPLLEMGGKLLVMKSEIFDGEEEAGRKVADILRFSCLGKRERVIGEEKARREIFVFRKEGEPDIKLPRRPGMAAKKPLVCK